MRIVGIDPGPEKSGLAVLRRGEIEKAAVLPNAELLSVIQDLTDDDLSDEMAIEMIASYGTAVGREVFDTCVWIGRFQQAWKFPAAVRLIFRKDVKLTLLNTHKATDANIREALIDRYGQPGTKTKPGPTFGINSHMWPAIAVALTAHLKPIRERKSAKR